MQISGYVEQLAQGVSQATGLNKDVVLAQWLAEEGVSSVADWPDNNPAGITHGNSAVDRLSTGVNVNGFDIFPTPAAGAKAYATLYNTDSSYTAVRAAAKTGNPMAQLRAIWESPWDAGHYGGDGHKLYATYESITGKHVIVPDTASHGYAVPPASSNRSGINNQIDFKPTNFNIVADSQRYGNILYGRRYRVVVSDQNGQALDVSDLQCTFNIRKVINQTPPFSTVVIYNLNPVTELAILEEGYRIIVEAGYEGSQYGTIFDGDVIEPIRDKPDNVTERLTIYALGANRQFNQAFANFSVNRGQSARSLLQNLASKSTVTTNFGQISDYVSDIKLPRGKAVFGMTRDYIRQIAQASNVAAYSEDGAINLIHAADPPSGEIIDLTSDSGLIGTPVQQGLGVSFKCLLNPSIHINSMVHIDDSLIQAQAFPIGQVPRPLDKQGIYRVMGVTHTGDTRGEDWYTECTSVSQAGGIPGSISATTGHLFGG